MPSESASSLQKAHCEHEIVMLAGSSNLHDFAAEPATEPFRILLEVELEFAEARRDRWRSGLRETIREQSKVNRAIRDGIRRAFDVSCAIAGLIVLAPLLAVVALAIKLEGRGPVLFSQSRVGKDLVRFRLFKFRSMIPNMRRQKPSHRAARSAGHAHWPISAEI